MLNQNFSVIDEKFKNSYYNNLNTKQKQNNQQNNQQNNEHDLLINKDIQLVKGSDYHKGIYDIPDKNLLQEIIVRYYQIAMFDEYNKCSIRTFLFKGSTSKGACFFDYKMIEINDYQLSKKKIDKFVKFLDKEKNKKNSKIKIMYKYYPVYNFNFTNPPNGNEINQCQSELLNNI
jgi:hypothetical protein